MLNFIACLDLFLKLLAIALFDAVAVAVLLLLIRKLKGGKAETQPAPAAVPVAYDAPAAAPVRTATPNVEDRKAFDAAIAAAIATYMGTEPEGLRILSIKKV